MSHQHIFTGSLNNSDKFSNYLGNSQENTDKNINYFSASTSRTTNINDYWSAGISDTIDRIPALSGNNLSEQNIQDNAMDTASGSSGSSQIPFLTTHSAILASNATSTNTANVNESSSSAISTNEHSNVVGGNSTTSTSEISSATFISPITDNSTPQTAASLQVKSLLETQTLDVASSGIVNDDTFSWGSIATPASPVFTGANHAAVDANTVDYIFQNILQRNPTSAEITQFSNEIDAHPLGNGNYDYTYAMSDVAHYEETTDKLQAAFQSAIGSTAIDDIITSGETYLTDGVSFTSLQNVIVSSNAAQINSIYNQVLGRSVDSSGLSSNEMALNSGTPLSTLRNSLAHSQEAQTDINSLYEQILGRDADSIGLNNFEATLANNGSLADVRWGLAYSQEAQNDIDSLYEQILGRSADSTGMNNIQANLALNEDLTEVRQGLISSTEATTKIQAIFSNALGEQATDDEVSGVKVFLGEGHSIGDVQTALSSPQDDGASGEISVYRVESETANNVRLNIDASGEVQIPVINTSAGVEKRLWLNFGDEARAYEYLFQKLAQLSDFVLKTFEVPTSFATSVDAASISETQGGAITSDDPIQGDETRTQNSYGLPSSWITRIRAVIVQGTGRIIS